MTYPTVSTTGQHTGAAFGVPSSPRFPQIEEAVLAYWAKDNTFLASVEKGLRLAQEGRLEDAVRAFEDAATVTILAAAAIAGFQAWRRLEKIDVIEVLKSRD